MAIRMYGTIISDRADGLMTDKQTEFIKTFLPMLGSVQNIDFTETLFIKILLKEVFFFYVFSFS